MAFEIANLQHDYAQIGGVRLHYVTAGAGEKLVILLHGFPEFWYSWRHQIAALSEDYTVVAPDLRGYNLSDKPKDVSDYAMEKLVDDVLGLIRHFGFEKAAIVGHDWGASVAWSLAQRFPERVSKVCALQVPPTAVIRKNMSLRQLLASWYMFFFQIPRLPEWILSQNDYAVLENIFREEVKKGVLTPEDVEEYKKSWRAENALTSALSYYRANFWRRFSTDSNKARAKIAVPTLFIYGEKDAAVLPETVKDVQSVVDAPYSEFRLPNAGHWVQQEAAADVNEVLRDFLADEE